MAPQCVLRWQNGTRGTQESDGMFVLWAHQGRPDASASIFPFEGSIHYELVSLSRESKLVGAKTAALSGRRQRPESRSKISRCSRTRRHPGCAAQADEGPRRPVQGRFDRPEGGQIGPRGTALLPRPLYRHELSEAPGPGADRIDGGVFAFVQGTDPEAILLLEAVHPDGRPRWQYAFARATSAGLEARLDKPVVWAVDFLDGRTTPRDPQMWLSRPRGKTASER